MVNIKNCYICDLNLYILFYINWIYLESKCWWCDCYVSCLWRNGELKVNVDELPWNELICVCYWEWCEYGIWWVEVGILSYVLNKEWFKLLWLWIGVVDMDWDD